MMNNSNRLPSYNSITDYHPPLRGEAEEQENSLIYSACTSDASILTDDDDSQEDTTSAITNDYYFEQDPFNNNGHRPRYYQSSDGASTTTGGSSIPPPPPPPLPRSRHRSNVYRRSSNNNNNSNNNNKSKCSSNVMYWMYVAGFLALGSIALSILIVSCNEDLMDWLSNTKEIGIKGRRAQNLADQSSIIGMSNPRHPSSFDIDYESSSSSWTVSASGNNQDESKEVQEGGSNNDVDVPLLGSSKKKLHDEEETQTPLLSNSIEEGCETTVMIIRHCERGNLKSHCNYLGYERAKHLQTLFGNSPNDLWPLPSQIYALQTKEHHKYEHVREVETVQFVASKSEIQIETTFGSNQIKELANTIISNITSGDMCGKLILISWKHADIPKLANHLGCGPLQGCPVDYKGDSFDPVWQIKYVYRNFLSGQKTKKKKTATKYSDFSKSSSSSYWDMYGTVQSQNFDPLAFSKKFGDYPLGGTSKGGRWNTNNDNDNGGDTTNPIPETTASSAVVKQFYG